MEGCINNRAVLKRRRLLRSIRDAVWTLLYGLQIITAMGLEK